MLLRKLDIIARTLPLFVKFKNASHNDAILVLLQQNTLDIELSVGQND